MRLVQPGRLYFICFKVVIVGAGLADLSAGYELLQAGHDVQILDAQHRVGGRIYTLREPFA